MEKEELAEKWVNNISDEVNAKLRPLFLSDLNEVIRGEMIKYDMTIWEPVNLELSKKTVDKYLKSQQK